MDNSKDRDKDFEKEIKRIEEKFVEELFEILDEQEENSDWDEELLDQLLDKLKAKALSLMVEKTDLENKYIISIIREHYRVLEEIYKADVESIFEMINEMAKDL